MILGIDPGLDGALAIVDGAKVLAVFDMPTHEVTVSKKLRRLVDQYALARWFELQTVDRVVLEHVGPQRKDSPQNAFKFGRGFGILEALLAANQLPTQYVYPQKWKAALGLIGQQKDASRRRASEIYPLSAHLWPLKKHEGRAEAALLAHYGARFAT